MEDDEELGVEAARLRDVVLKAEVWFFSKLVLSEIDAGLDEWNELGLGRLASSAHV